MENLGEKNRRLPGYPLSVYAAIPGRPIIDGS